MHFLRLDNREPDFIKRYFLKRSLGGDFSCRGRIISKRPLSP
ncbi:hypothetical protein HPHPH29_0645 [Helicobacter pylori Hp H-29]|nr:hypothetical protein HPHPH29_0645 [Helicobacter pylori Hp H-29]